MTVRASAPSAMRTADLARAASRRERHDPVEADGRHRQGGDAERDEQRAERAIEPGVERVLIAQGSDPVERQRGIELVHRVLDGRRVGHRRLLGPDRQAHEVDHVLGERDVDAFVRGIDRADGAAQVQVRHHAHDRPPGHVAGPSLMRAPSGSPVREEQLHEVLVRRSPQARLGAVRAREATAAYRLDADHVEVAGRDDDAPARAGDPGRWDRRRRRR